MSSCRVLTVLGMHRSGTSCLVEGLESAGVAACVSGDPHLGPLREHVEIMLLNESVLNQSCGSWADPPKRITWTQEHRAARDRFIDRLRLVAECFEIDPTA